MTAQAICLLSDGIQTVLDVGNKHLTNLAKCLSISRTVLSTISLTAIVASLSISGAGSVIVPILIVCTAFRVMLFSINFWVGDSRFISAG